ncbi:hypothetical protein FRC10_003606 [Ceratobasidium sp. 414]|nr:hypothetical protein FRC10_003606 [Ceratobasidium sp. 414]
MATVLDNPLLFYSLQTLKENDQDAPPSEEEAGAPISHVLQALPSEPVSIPTFVNSIQRSAPRAPPLYVAGIEWRAAPGNEMYHEYAVIHASIAPQTPPVIAIRVDRFGKLGTKPPWWRRRPATLEPNTIRDSTTVIAGPIDDHIANPSTGSSITKYTHWAHELPSSVSIPELRRLLERARNDACTALNHAVRPHVSNSLHMSSQQTRHGRRWADSRGLQFVHVDIAGTVADAMDIGIVRCAIQYFWASILPGRMLWRTVRQSVRVREEYSHVVRDYRQNLRRIVQSLPSLDSDVRTKISNSWGIEESEIHSPLLIQLLNESLSRHAFISPHAPMATMLDVASRLDTIVPLLPPSGPSINMCLLHARSLLARFPDELWHAYTTPAPPIPVSTTRAMWRRARDSRMFWLGFEIVVQWIIVSALAPVNSEYDFWVFALPFMHAAFIMPWVLKERKTWRRIWKVYEGAIIQGDGVEWENDLNTLSSQSRVSLLSTKDGGASGEISLQTLRKPCVY